MTSHLRADLIRLRGRWDTWVIGFGVPVLAAVGFVQGYLNVGSHYGWDPSQPIPAEVIAAIAAERAGYAFPHSLLSMLGSTPWLLVAAFFLTSMSLGLEYGWGTIRTSLLASPDRRRFLVARLTVLAVGGLAILASFVLLGLVLPDVLALTGNVPPPSPEVLPIQVAGAAVAGAIALGFALSFAALLAIATRNPALPLLISLIYFVLEGYVANLSQWRELHLELVARSLPFASVAALLGDSLDPAHYGIGAPNGAGGVNSPLVLSLVIVAGWAILFAVISDALLRRSDIHE